MISPITKFCCEGRENHSNASELEGTLLISRSQFPYFVLIAFEAGGPIRAFFLLLIAPIISLLESFGLDAAAFQIMIFVAMVGLRVTDAKAVAKVVLPRFYLEDLCEITYGVFSKCKGKKYVVTCSPRIMVEAFLRGFMDVDYVIGTAAGD